MTDVLVLTVGGSPAPLIHAIEQNGPDLVVFLCSGGDGQGASEPTVAGVTRTSRRGSCPTCGPFQVDLEQRPLVEMAHLREGQWRIVAVENPDDLGALMEALGRLESELPSEARVVANYTGGTKTMSLALGLHALRAGWQLQVQASFPRRDLVAVRAGDLAQVQDLLHLRVSDTAARASELIAAHEPGSARAVLDAVLSKEHLSADQRERLASLRQRAAMLEAWDRFDHATALQHANEAGTRSTLKQLARAVQLFESGEPWGARDVPGNALVRDLLAHAERRAARGLHDDAVARLYRATELLAQVRLRQRHGLSTSDLDPRDLPEGLRAWADSLHRTSAGRLNLGLMAGWDLLRRLDDPLGAWFTCNEAALVGFLGIRNRGLNAHGLRPVTRDDWAKTGRAWLAWLTDALAEAERSA